MAEEEKINTDIDDWLNDLEEEDSGAEELDQADIDSLLGSDAESAPEEEAGSEELSGELDQADIDSLIGQDTAEEGEPAEEAGGEELSGELDQADIDSLLGQDTAEEGEPAEEAGGLANEEETIDQEEMDRLFGSSAGQEETPGDEVDFAEILGDQEDTTAFSDLDTDTFSLEPDDDAAKTVLQPPKTAAAEPAAEADEMPEHFEAVGPQKPLSSRVLQVLLGLLIALLLGGGGAAYYYYFGIKGTKKAIIVTEKEKPAVPPVVPRAVPPAAPRPQKKQTPPLAGQPNHKPVAMGNLNRAPAKGEEGTTPLGRQPNHKPVAMGNLYQMPAKGGEVAIQLQAEDADGDHLTYKVVNPPSHGRLSGKAPSLVYLPNSDFPGRDSFTFRASDGKDVGPKAAIYINGPDLAATKKQHPAGKQVVRQKKMPAKVLAKDVALRTTSSQSLIIDWLALWKQAGDGGVDSNCGVEVKSGALQGKLSRLDEWHYRYQPPKFFQGLEVISYRFKKGKKFSVNRLLTIKVRLGDNKPEIVLAPLAHEYLTGQTVTVDAQGSRDEKRDKLRFVWRQLSGVPIKLKAENRERSIVSFVMPSFFTVDADNGLTIQLTVIDAGGKRSSRDIHLRSLSRRRQALWNAPSALALE